MDVQVELEAQRRKAALETRKTKSEADQRSLDALRDRAARETDPVLKRELEGQVVELSTSLKAEAETLASIEADFTRSENAQAASRRTRRERQQNLLAQRQIALGQQHPPSGTGEDETDGTPAPAPLKSGRRPSKTKKRSKRKDKSKGTTLGLASGSGANAKVLSATDDEISRVELRPTPRKKPSLANSNEDNGNNNEVSGSDVIGRNETNQDATSDPARGAAAMTSPLSVAVGEAADIQPVRTLSRRQRSRSRRRSARDMEAADEVEEQ